ncbi:MAG: glycosyltransferase [Bacteroides sp.]|nr:glycosyltransferase [Bacteroides sp.]MCM1096412.1 glycosyltransferase [Terasakiella sp.]
MKDISISVIIPVYNAAPWLERCIESVCSQSVSDIEILLIDDGSTDGSAALCDAAAAADPRIRVFHKPNGGVSAARNFAICKARGRWLAFVDADDTLPADSLRLRLDAGQRTGADAVIGDYCEIGVDGSTHDRHSGLPAGLNDRDGVVNNILVTALEPNTFFGSPCNKLYRRELFERGGITFPARKRGEDWMVNIAYFELAKSCAVISDVVYNYHRNTASAMAKAYPEQPRLWRESLALKRRLIDTYGYQRDAAADAAVFFGEVVEHLLRVAGGGGGYAMAREALELDETIAAARAANPERLYRLARILRPPVAGRHFRIAWIIARVWALIAQRR